MTGYFGHAITFFLYTPFDSPPPVILEGGTLGPTEGSHKEPLPRGCFASLNMTGYFGHAITFFLYTPFDSPPPVILEGGTLGPTEGSHREPLPRGCFASLNMTGLSRDLPSLFFFTLHLDLFRLSSLRAVLYGPTEGSHVIFYSIYYI